MSSFMLIFILIYNVIIYLHFESEEKNKRFEENVPFYLSGKSSEEKVAFHFLILHTSFYLSLV